MERCREERGLFPEHHFRPSLYRADSASRARGRGRLLGAPSGAGCTAAAGSAEHPSVEQLFDLYGFVAILLRTSNLIARSVAGGSAAFLVFIAAPLAREAKNAEGARLLALARRWVLAAAAATLAAALAGVALQAVALAGTLWAPRAWRWPRWRSSRWLRRARLRGRCQRQRGAALCAAALALATAAIGDSH